MKTKISTFIVTTVLLLFGTSIISAQSTKAYFKKDGITIFESAISDIDSIVFKPIFPTLSVEPSELSFTAKATESYDVIVSTNQKSWDATSDATWCIVTKGTNQFTVTAMSNTSTSDRTATITVTAGNATDVTLSVTQKGVAANIAFFAGSPLIEYLYSTSGFFTGCRINFNLVVYDDAGLTSITIEEIAKGAPNGNSKQFSQKRVIPISGPGTYQLSQEIQRSTIYGNIYSLFNYTVSASGKSYSTNYPGDYSSYNGSWDHYFVIK